MMRTLRRAGTAPGERRITALSGLREPIVVILLLIALFTAISGKPLDGVFMLVVATGLAWDAARRARSRAPAPGGGDPAVPAPAAEAAAAEARAAEAAAARGRPRRPLLIVTGLAVGALYAALVGSFARYSWPA